MLAQLASDDFVKLACIGKQRRHQPARMNNHTTHARSPVPAVSHASTCTHACTHKHMHSCMQQSEPLLCAHCNRTTPEGAKVMHGDVVSLKSALFQGNGLHISSLPIALPTMLPEIHHPYVGATFEVRCTVMSSCGCIDGGFSSSPLVIRWSL